MHSILHKINIDSNPEALFLALSTDDGLSNWWTKARSEGKLTTFYFGAEGEHRVVMETLHSAPGKEIRWKCTDGPWVDKGEFVFSIVEEEKGVSLDFAHHGWAETDDFYKHCNPKWAFFLAVSLKQYLETGTGSPHPKDPSI